MAARHGVRYHTMAEVEQRGWDATMKRVVAEASEEGRQLYISFDIDVIDPAFAVATGTPVAGGINMREAITIVRRLCAEANVIGFELVELHPYLDLTYMTTMNSAHVIKACLTGRGRIDGAVLPEPRSVGARSRRLLWRSG